MLEYVGDGFTQGKYIYFHDIGAIAPGKKTRKFEVCNRDSAIIIGYIKWWTHWKKYCFFPINCMLDSDCQREIADFCDFQTSEQRKTWKPVKSKFRKKYDMTNRDQWRAEGRKNV